MLLIQDDSVSFSEMVHLINSGKAEGMAALYNSITRCLRTYLGRQMGPQDLEDQLHDVYLEVLRAIQQDQLRDPERLMGFVRTVARRKVAVHIDTAARSRRDLVRLEPDLCVAGARSTPERELISREHAEIMTKTLARLSAREREVLSRFYIQEQTQEHICSEMGLTATQFRLLKWRSKARFLQLGRKTFFGTGSVPATACTTPRYRSAAK